MRKSLIHLLCSISLLFSLSPTPSISHEQVEILAIHYPPYVDSESPVGGIGPELFNAAFGAVGVETQLLFQPFARIIASPSNEIAPAKIGPYRSISEKSKKDFAFIHLTSAQRVFFYNKEKYPQGISFESLKDLGKYTILSLRGAYPTRLLREAGLQVQDVSTQIQGFQMLEKKRGDLATGLELSGSKMLHHLFPEKSHQFQMTRPYSLAYLGLIFSRKHPDGVYYCQKLKKGLQLIIANGIYEKILRKYYNTPLPDYLFEKIDPAIIGSDKNFERCK